MAVTVFLIALLRSQLVQSVERAKKNSLWIFPSHKSFENRKLTFEERFILFHAMTKALRAFFYERLNEGKLDERDNHRNYVTLKSLIGKVFFGTEIDKIWAFLLF